eukprot:4671550-Amphidinium_carterae.1
MDIRGPHNTKYYIIKMRQVFQTPFSNISKRTTQPPPFRFEYVVARNNFVKDMSSLSGSAQERACNEKRRGGAGSEQQLAHMLAGNDEAPREEKLRLAANYYVLKALDHCLQVSFKKGLATYIPGKLLRPLEKCEAKCLHGQEQRMCVFDSEAKRSWYEISPEALPCLHIISDQGPMGWP